jgi:phosphatidate phosphatase APP1
MRAPPPLLLPLLAALASPAAARAETSVAVFPALGRPTLVTVTGRVTHGTPERAAAPLARNARRLLTKSKEGVAVSVTFAGATRRVTTGDDGLFEATFPAQASAPFAPGLHAIRAEVETASASGRVQVVSDAAPFIVVSDLDDTLAVSNVQSPRRLARAALLEDERTQPAVEGMAALFRCLAEASDAPGFAIVSGSPLEYGPRVEGFLAARGFPFAALALRHLGAGTMSGYKEPAIRALLSRFPHRVVLVGDSGERDPEVYAAIRREFPDRVAAILIHDVGRSADPARFEGMVLFATAAEAARAAAEKALLPAACAERAFPAAPSTPPR